MSALEDMHVLEIPAPPQKQPPPITNGADWRGSLVSYQTYGFSCATCKRTVHGVEMPTDRTVTEAAKTAWENGWLVERRGGDWFALCSPCQNGTPNGTQTKETSLEHL